MKIPSEASTVIEVHKPPDNGEISSKMEYLAQTSIYH